MKTINKATSLVLGAAIAALSAMGIVAPANAAVLCPDGKTEVTDLSECNDITAQSKDRSLMGTLNVIINVVIGVIGFVAVVVIILGGIQYTTSAGASDKVATAKNTILYGIIGLVIALLAFAIVNFVLANVFGS